MPAGFLYVDGTVGDVGHGVLRDRRVLAEEGVVVVVATVDPHAGEVVSPPEIITRGWVHAPEAEELLEEASDVVRVALEKALADGGRRPGDPAPPRPQGPGPAGGGAHPAPAHDRARAWSPSDRPRHPVPVVARVSRIPQVLRVATRGWLLALWPLW